MKNTWRIILSGSGGQGMGVAGKILAEAAFLQGLNTTQSQTYGAGVRGDLSQSGIIISNEDILFPLIEKPDLLVILNNKSYGHFAPILNSNGARTILIYDQDHAPPPKGKVNRLSYGFTVVNKAREIYSEKGACMVALGILTGLWIPLDKTNVSQAIQEAFPGKTGLQNIKCFEEGLKLAEKKHPLRTSKPFVKGRNIFIFCFPLYL